MSAVPECASECGAVARRLYADACRRAGLPVPDTHVTHAPLLVPPLYEDLNMRCPHGVLWHMQPTSEQIAEWVRDGVE